MINITFNGEKMGIPKDSSFIDLIDIVKCDFQPIIAKANNVLVDLSRVVHENSKVELLGVSDPNGYLAYQRSVSFMAYVAIKELFGKKARMIIKHSISKNYYCYVDGISMTDDDVNKMRNIMLTYVKEQHKIERKHVRVDVASKLMKELNNPVRKELITYEVENSIVLYELKGIHNFFYDVLASNCKDLDNFDIEPYNDGFVIVFPNRSNMEKEPVLKTYEKISKVFEESAKWTDILDVTNLASINNLICDDKIENLIKINEALHDKKIGYIADRIAEQQKKVVLIAGPSSSGKTTFSKRLCVHLEVNGLKPVVIGLDDYYKNREDIPYGPDGRQNFEVIETLEIEMINRDLAALLRGEEVSMPHFNFVTGEKEWKGHTLKLEKNSVIVIEGIHGLNDRLTEEISKDLKFKIFIAALTQINVDDINRISTRDTRLIRRLVRDHKFRGFKALTTLAMWGDVLQGEADNIFPYQEEADEIFNSALVYELALLKSYVLPILYKVAKEDEEYSEARRLIKFLNNSLSIPAECIPSDSLVREFIGGSVFE